MSYRFLERKLDLRGWIKERARAEVLTCARCCFEDRPVDTLHVYDLALDPPFGSSLVRWLGAMDTPPAGGVKQIVSYGLGGSTSVIGTQTR